MRKKTEISASFEKGSSDAVSGIEDTPAHKQLYFSNAQESSIHCKTCANYYNSGILFYFLIFSFFYSLFKK